MNSVSAMHRPVRKVHVNPLAGIVNLNKPFGLTSARAVDQVRTVTHQRKSGHGGTLDPRATGVLLVCLGKSTKLVELIMDQPKVYRTTARLDVTNIGYDMERETISVECPRVPTQKEIIEACSTFEGYIAQVPPERSAVKVRGVPAYKLSARGKTLELRPRRVRIDWICVHKYEWPTIDFEMCCGRGTYVRSLIRDLGAKLGVGGCLETLERKSIGPFTIENAHTVDSMREQRDNLDFIIRHEQALEMLTNRKSVPPRPIVIDREI